MNTEVDFWGLSKEMETAMEKEQGAAGGRNRKPPLFFQIRASVAGRLMILAALCPLFGCASIISRYSTQATTKMAGNLSRTFMNYDDLATVKAAAPAYLVMMDTLLAGDPDNETLLLGAAKLYTSYTSAFVKDPKRAARLSEKGFHYALRAACDRCAGLRGCRKMPFGEFTKVLARMTRADVPVLYGLGSAWAAYLEARSGDWNAAAQLPRVEAIMKRVVDLDETYQDGSAHLYLGVFATLVPPALGGHPAVAKRHFERALEISGKKNLMAYVLYAKHYAKEVFDRPLYERLLKEVLAADPKVDGYVLINMAAQAEATQLLAGADAYF
jgi:TRAP transporter T-component